MSQPSRYKRVLLKISGEVMMGDLEYGIDRTTVERLAAELSRAIESGEEVFVASRPTGGAEKLRRLAIENVNDLLADLNQALG